MKKFILVILLVLLTGCTVSKSSDIYSDIDNCLKYLDQSFDIRTNHNTEYYSYYLPSDMQDYEGNENSAVMKYNNATIVMNLNIASIVNAESFGINGLVNDGFLNQAYKIYEHAERFIKNDGEISEYLVEVYEKNDCFLAYVITDELIFYATCDEYDLIETIRHIFTIASSIETDKTKVVSNYSKKDVIEYIKEQVNLFEYDIPSSGFLNDLVNQSGGTIIIDESDVVDENEENIDETIDEESGEEIENENDENDSFE